MRKFLLLVIGLVIVGVVGLYFSVNALVKKGVEIVGSEVAKVDVRLDKSKISLFSGTGQLSGLFVGNPKGYKTDSAFTLRNVRVDLNVRSVFSDKIVINRLSIDAPQITYEMAKTGSNIDQILKNIRESAVDSQEAGRKEGTSAGKDKSTGKKVQIDDVIITNGTINLSATMLQGKAASLTLRKIHLKDIGTSKGGVTPAEAAEKIITVVTRQVSRAVASPLKSIGEEIVDPSKLGEIGTNAGQAVTEGAGGVVKGLKGLFEKKK